VRDPGLPSPTAVRFILAAASVFLVLGLGVGYLILSHVTITVCTPNSYAHQQLCDKLYPSPTPTG